ncbi:hypothetical protein XENTR_v10018906 [Xenopus tropicalis]|uniref:Transmembrane protein 26 n=2 Tax=Xenopus tropicalis TaxID=8364 RepID=A0A8J0SV98_XENTR|nr:transmembrane protein 26 [Xenopus tropicalis]KAE8592879.1 hypothetical protein XENTR_v10018906 [Xenopus tropicalis]|eukprot:XP_017950941.1 PREDICTED: transmembrane protein 26-like [Xenopus tropicalis]
MITSPKIILWSIISRILFTAHGALLVWVVVEMKNNQLYWILLIGLLLLSLEMVVTLAVTEKGEWKWFSPMVFLYLTAAIPSIFLLELDFLQYRIVMSNSTQTEHLPTDAAYFIIYNPWLLTLEQVMILVIVMGRWIMPKGEMDRIQLTELLLIYIGLGADILDILNLIKDPQVETCRMVNIVGLSIFSWALLQFTLVLTQTQSSDSTDNDEMSSSVKGTCGSSCCTNEVWSLLIAVGMQDGPFLIFRLYVMIKEQVLNEMMIFFICKNIFTVIIEIYRIFVIQCSKKSGKNE